MGKDADSLCEKVARTTYVVLFHVFAFFLFKNESINGYYIFFDLLPAVIYLLKVKNRNTRTKCEIRSKLTMVLTLKIVNFEHISHFVLVLLLLTLNM